MDSWARPKDRPRRRRLHLGQGQPQRRHPTLAPKALLVADARTNSLIVSASPRDLAEIAALINRIDTPGVGAALKVFNVKNGDAESLATTLRTLFGVSTEQAAAAGPPGLAQGGPVRVQFSVDQRTNSIIAAGSQDDLTVVEAILLAARRRRTPRASQRRVPTQERVRRQTWPTR